MCDSILNARLFGQGMASSKWNPWPRASRTGGGTAEELFQDIPPIPLQFMALTKALMSAQSQAPSLPGVALPSSHDGRMQL